MTLDWTKSLPIKPDRHPIRGRGPIDISPAGTIQSGWRAKRNRGIHVCVRLDRSRCPLYMKIRNRISGELRNKRPAIACNAVNRGASQKLKPGHIDDVDRLRPAGPRLSRVHTPKVRRMLVQRSMRPRLVVIGGIALQNAAQVRLAEYDHVIEAFASN